MKAAIEAIKLFNIQGAVESIAPFGLGHINDSYSATIAGKLFLLQRLNTNAFQQPELVEKNLQNLLSKAPDLFPTHYKGINQSYHQTTTAGVWRLQELVPNSYSPTLLSLAELTEVSKAFGRFISEFITEKPKNYVESIPQFHSLHIRLHQLDDAIKNDKVGRKKSVQEEIQLVNRYRWIMTHLDVLVEKRLPERVCHNDAKAANCLLDINTKEFKRIVDLDTVGPGYVLYDFGDLMRSMLFNIPENHSDLSDLKLDHRRFEIMLESFLAECKNSLNEMEVDSLTFGGLYMTYIMAVRFLADYLNGDIYYKIGFSDENLVRTRNQLKILQLMDQEFAIQPS